MAKKILISIIGTQCKDPFVKYYYADKCKTGLQTGIALMKFLKPDKTIFIYTLEDITIQKKAAEEVSGTKEFVKIKDLPGTQMNQLMDLIKKIMADEPDEICFEIAHGLISIQLPVLTVITILIAMREQQSCVPIVKVFYSKEITEKKITEKTDIQRTFEIMEIDTEVKLGVAMLNMIYGMESLSPLQFEKGSKQLIEIKRKSYRNADPETQQDLNEITCMLNNIKSTIERINTGYVLGKLTIAMNQQDFLVEYLTRMIKDIYDAPNIPERYYRLVMFLLKNRINPSLAYKLAVEYYHMKEIEILKDIDPEQLDSPKFRNVSSEIAELTHKLFPSDSYEKNLIIYQKLSDFRNKLAHVFAGHWDAKPIDINSYWKTLKENFDVGKIEYELKSIKQKLGDAKTRYVITSSISAKMFGAIDHAYELRFEPKTRDEIRDLLQTGKEVYSIVGHENTSKKISTELGVEIPFNRENYQYILGDYLILADLQISRPDKTKEFTDEDIATAEVKYLLISTNYKS